MDSELISYDGLFSHGKCVDLVKGEVLHRSDEICDAMGLVLHGELKLSRIRSTGKELYIKAFGAGDIFAELIIFSGGKYPGWLTATKATRIVEVKLPQLLEYLNDRKALVSFITKIAGKMSHLSDMIEVQSLKTVRQKIAFSLLYGKIDLIQSDSHDNRRFQIKVSQFAEYLDCSREAVSRALSQMESEGMIDRNEGYLTIINRKKIDDLL